MTDPTHVGVYCFNHPNSTGYQYVAFAGKKKDFKQTLKLPKDTDPLPARLVEVIELAEDMRKIPITREPVKEVFGTDSHWPASEPMRPLGHITYYGQEKTAISNHYFPKYYLTNDARGSRLGSLIEAACLRHLMKEGYTKFKTYDPRTKRYNQLEKAGIDPYAENDIQKTIEAHEKRVRERPKTIRPF